MGSRAHMLVSLVSGHAPGSERARAVLQGRRLWRSSWVQGFQW